VDGSTQLEATTGTLVHN